MTPEQQIAALKALAIIPSDALAEVVPLTVSGGNFILPDGSVWREVEPGEESETYYINWQDHRHDRQYLRERVRAAIR